MINLVDVIESKHEPEILSFFLLAPNRAFYIKELSARLGIGFSNLLHILNKMVKKGGLRTFTSQGKKYFLLKREYKPFPELRNALLKDKLKYEDELFLSIQKLRGLKAAFLSGLFVGMPELPVDILFVGKLSKTALEKFLRNCEKVIGQEVDYSIMAPDDFQIRRNTFDRFYKDIFDYPYLVVMDNQRRPKSKLNPI